MTNIALGLFHEPQSALAAAGTLKGAGFATPELMSPIPIEGVEEVLGEKKSVIKRFTLFGGLFGGLFGFALAAGTAVLYLHPVGGRPIITIPPYLIITYELLIFFGIIFTVLGFFISARLPAFRDRVYVPETGVDKFAVTVACDDEEHFKRAEAILHEAGAEQVREVEEEG
ncbi:MAG: quinol:electron acceptor oxidoreductase subunit ActD [Pseudomonadales bacterium]